MKIIKDKKNTVWMLMNKKLKLKMRKMKMDRMSMKKRSKMTRVKKVMKIILMMVKIIMININNLVKNKTSIKMKVLIIMKLTVKDMNKDKRDMRILTNIIHRNSMKTKKGKENISMVDKKVKSLLKSLRKNMMNFTRFFNSLRVPLSIHTCNSSRTHNQFNKHHM